MHSHILSHKTEEGVVLCIAVIFKIAKSWSQQNSWLGGVFSFFFFFLKITTKLLFTIISNLLEEQIFLAMRCMLDYLGSYTFECISQSFIFKKKLRIWRIWIFFPTFSTWETEFQRRWSPKSLNCCIAGLWHCQRNPKSRMPTTCWRDKVGSQMLTHGLSPA